jgi:uncharacterized membrane protein
MNESQLALLFGAGQTLLIGVLMLIVPRVTRRGLLFGVYVGEAAAEGEPARRLTRDWTVQTIIAIAASCAVGLVVGWLTRPALAIPSSMLLLVSAFFATYLAAHRQARLLAAPTTMQISVGALTPRPAASVVLPILTLVIAISLGLGSLAYAAVQYRGLPGQVPIHFGPTGEPDRWVEKSPGAVFLVPALNLLLGVTMAGAALLVATAKRSLRRESSGASLAAQQRFHSILSTALCLVALLFSTMFTIGTVSTIRVALGEAQRLHWLTMFLTAAATAVIIGAIAYVAARVGQGGGRLEGAVADAPLAGGLADNRHWILGLIYFNRDDPSIMIEHRFGIGYTINFGNWRAVGLLLGFLALLALIVLVAAAL